MNKITINTVGQLLDNVETKEKATKLVFYIKDLQQENKQLKEQLENDIDRYEDTISYQLGFDKGKEYLQQRIDKAIEYIRSNEWAKDYEISNCRTHLLEIL